MALADSFPTPPYAPVASDSYVRLAQIDPRDAFQLPQPVTPHLDPSSQAALSVSLARSAPGPDTDERGNDPAAVTSPVRISVRKRALFSGAICLFILFHLGLSLRGALMQDDRFAWRMFHNVGFSQVSYAWVMSDGRTKNFKPEEKSLVKRSHLYLMPSGGWRPTYYSEGTTRNMVDNYARYMGEHKRPEWAVAFRATLKMRINDEKEFTKHVYQYPKGGK